ncbi:MAG: 5'-nucleotidase C-terminal domain-containing protein [Ilumatobacteraceae bacterium]
MKPSRTRRWSVGCAVAAMASLMVVHSPTSAAPAVAGPGQVDLTLLNFNDFHGRIDADTLKFVTTIEQQRILAGAGNSVLLSAGDNIGASGFASAVQQDQPTIDLLNQLGVAASAVGNHEFDTGWPDLRDRVINGGANAQYHYLAANVYDSGGTPILPEYQIVTVAGVELGIIGVVTTETPGMVSPSGVVGLTFGDPVAAVNRVAAQLSDGIAANGEADVLVAEYHDGASTGADISTFAAEVAKGGPFAAIVNDTSPLVDAIFTAHTHKKYAWDAPIPGDPTRTRPILQAESYGTNLGRIVLTVDTTVDPMTISSYASAIIPRAATADPTLPRVAAVTPGVNSALAFAATIGNQTVGSLSADITTAFTGGGYTNGVYTGTTRDNRAAESTIGKLVADSMLNTLKDPAYGGATIAVMNPGGLRAELLYAPDGVVLYSEANLVLPFANTLSTITLTGAQFKTLLEQQWQRLPNGTVPSRPYLQLGLSKNVTYTFDAALPEGSRITSITVDGAPINPVGQYRVGTNSFLAEGGDNFHVFRSGTNYRDSGLIDRDAWIAYITANSPLHPDFARQAVGVSPLPTTASIGQNLTFGVSGLDLTSQGSPQNTSLSAVLGGVNLGSVAVAAGAASVNLLVPPGTPLGAQSLVLVAAPSNTTVTIPVTVVDNRVVSTTTLTTNRTSQRFGGSQLATLTATVTLSDGTVAGGSVELLQDNVLVGTLPLVNGQATYTLPADTPAGAHVFVARYADSNTIAGSTSAPSTVTVTKASSATFLWTNKFVVRRGHTGPKLTAYVGLNSNATATGTVTFTVDGAVVGSAPVLNGSASLQLGSTLSLGVHIAYAQYSGAASINGSSSNPIPIIVIR